MRINSKGHMVFGSTAEAIMYAKGGGFQVDPLTLVATRPDMASSFHLERLTRGLRDSEYMWYRPYNLNAYT